MDPLDRLIAHHPSLTTLAVEIAVVAVLIGGAAWLWLAERRRRRRRRSTPGARPDARMRDDV